MLEARESMEKKEVLFSWKEEERSDKKRGGKQRANLASLIHHV